MKTNEEKIRQTVFFLKPVLERKVRTMEVLTLWWQHTPDKNKQKPKKKQKTSNTNFWRTENKWDLSLRSSLHTVVCVSGAKWELYTKFM